MKATASCAIAAVLLSMGAGCSRLLVGHWEMIEPARGPATALRLKRVTFDRDGTFRAAAVRHGKALALSGSYRLTPRTLILETPADPRVPSRTFQARLLGTVLRLSRGEMVIRLRRIRR